MMTLALLVALAGAPAGADAPALLPERAIERLDGEPVALRSILDERELVLLDFWASWCLPCRQAFPKYAALGERYAEHGFAVVTVSQDDARGQRKIPRILDQLEVEFPVLLDADKSLGRALGVANLPTSFLVNAEGEIVWTHRGFLPGDERRVEAQIREQLGLEPQR